MVQNGCDHLKSVHTSCCTWQLNSVAWPVVELLIWISTREVVYSDLSALKLSCQPMLLIIVHRSEGSVVNI